jgi:transcriptional regulator with XRE-family HTH domain
VAGEANRDLRLFGDSIRRHRMALDVSQEKFAELCGLHRTYIGQVERGEKNVSFLNIQKISSALRMKPSTLFGSAKL